MDAIVKRHFAATEICHSRSCKLLEHPELSKEYPQNGTPLKKLRESETAVGALNSHKVRNLLGEKNHTEGLG